MILPKIIAADTGKVGLEALTVVALLASQRIVHIMLLAVMLTLTWSTPSIYVKVFPTRKPVHPTLLRPARHKFELLAAALSLLAAGVKLLPKVLISMVGKTVAAEAFGVSTKPRTLALLAGVGIGNLPSSSRYIDASLYGLLGMHVLVVHQLASSWGRSEPE